MLNLYLEDKVEIVRFQAVFN